jgi:SH3 domain-containing YSC84-like protein 1
MNKHVLTLIAVLSMLSATMWADKDRTKELDRINAATDVLNEIVAAPDKGIAEDILAKAKCVAVIPSLKKGGFIFGANYGKGVATCRTAHGWSAPAPIKTEGGSWGAQIGGEAVDVVMLVMNQKGMESLLNSKFKIGADVSGAAGPVGREAAANTDWKMKSEVLTYSRARGAFAGITLNGAAIVQDKDDTNALFGRDVDFRSILNGSVPPPAGTQAFLRTVARDFHEAREAHNEKKSSSSSAPAH